MRLGTTHLTRVALERWQLDRLNEAVAWGRGRSPFYKRLYGSLPAVPLQSLSQLADLPFVTEADVEERGLDMLCVSQGDIARVVTLPTSGTTGPPKRVWFTEPDLELTVEHFHHGMKNLVRTGECVLVLMPGERPGTVGALLRTALERSGTETIIYGFLDDTEAVSRVVEEREVDCLVGVPGQVLALARSKEGRRIARGRLKSVLLSGDYVSRALRDGIVAAWECAVFEHYGSTEMGLGGAVQCQAFAGRHIREADLLFEVVEPATGRSKPDGEEGEIVVTTLTRKGMPLIRYRTGDRGRILPHPCPCGSILRCLDKVRGRLVDTVHLGSGDMLAMADLDEVLYELPWVIGFSARMTREGGSDRLLLDMEAVTGTSADAAREVEKRAAAAPGIARAGLKVDAVVTGERGASVGTAKRRIEDERGHCVARRPGGRGR